jgi:hypothetical protein
MILIGGIVNIFIGNYFITLIINYLYSLNSWKREKIYSFASISFIFHKDRHDLISWITHSTIGPLSSGKGNFQFQLNFHPLIQKIMYLLDNQSRLPFLFLSLFLTAAVSSFLLESSGNKEKAPRMILQNHLCFYKILIISFNIILHKFLGTTE